VVARSALKRNNRVEEGGASSSRMKKEHESIDLRAHKMMRGRVEPFAVPIVVQVIKKILAVPQMTSP
jgi:hypothetical protein